MHLAEVALTLANHPRFICEHLTRLSRDMLSFARCTESTEISEADTDSTENHDRGD